MSNQKLHTDKELFALITLGNETAFTEIYLRYTAKLYPHVSKLLEHELWAEEIIQDVFLKIWQNRETLSGIDNPSAYLYRMASNRTLDFLKHRSLEIKMQYKVGRMAEQWSKLDVQEKIDFNNADSLFKDAVRSLPEKQQQIFRLRHEQDMSYEEIAASLQLSKNTVRNQLARGMDTVRSYLLDKGLLLIVWLYFRK